MEINKKINLNIKKDQFGHILVYDLNTLALVMGTTAVVGNCHLYGIEKKDHVWHVPVKAIKERILELEAKKQRLSDKLDIMTQIEKL